jgi:hypothetical protein
MITTVDRNQNSSFNAATNPLSQRVATDHSPTRPVITIAKYPLQQLLITSHFLWQPVITDYSLSGTDQWPLLILYQNRCPLFTHNSYYLLPSTTALVTNWPPPQPLINVHPLLQPMIIHQLLAHPLITNHHLPEPLITKHLITQPLIMNHPLPSLINFHHIHSLLVITVTDHK